MINDKSYFALVNIPVYAGSSFTSFIAWLWSFEKPSLHSIGRNRCREIPARTHHQ